MNYKDACRILSLTTENTDKETLKRQYKINALLYHPDKNKSANATEKFQEVHDAYEYILKYEGHMDEDTDTDDDIEINTESEDDTTSYRGMLSSFIRNIVNSENNNQLFYIILNRISSVCETNALDTLNKLDAQTLIKVYELIIKYKQSMHFGDDFIQKIGDIINNKVKENECIILNPTINDLFENNLYKLKVNNATYIIPLWHNELVYDNDGNDIYIKCNPMLPENIEIDATNNICMHITRNILDIWGKDVVKLDIGKHTIPIIISQLKLVPVQTIVFAKMGISKINTKDVYDVSKKSDLHIILTLQL